MTLTLKTVLASLRITQEEFAAEVGVARHEVNRLLNHGHWPPRRDKGALSRRIRRFVRDRGGRVTGLFSKVASPRGATRDDAVSPQCITNDTNDEESLMLLRKQSLTQEARRHFGLTRDPFADPITHDEVYLNAEIRYVRESMYQVARHGGFMAVIGESGAGKSTLREELVSRIQREEQGVVVVEPYVLAMEGQDKVGKTLRSQHIAEAVMATVAPNAKILSSPEARFRQLHHTLRDSARAGMSHVLLIEEAHCLPVPTLKHLKRFRELKDGLKPLLSVILLGQPELEVKLSEQNPELREVVQRIEVVRLPPLGQDVEKYLEHRFQRAGTRLDRVFANGALDALRSKLTPARAADNVTLLYPLAVHNTLAGVMNTAAELAIAPVTAELIRSA